MFETDDVEQFQHCNGPNLWENQKWKCNHISNLLIHIPSMKLQGSEFQLLKSETGAPKPYRFRLQTKVRY